MRDVRSSGAFRFMPCLRLWIQNLWSPTTQLPFSGGTRRSSALLFNFCVHNREKILLIVCCELPVFKLYTAITYAVVKWDVQSTKDFVSMLALPRSFYFIDKDIDGFVSTVSRQHSSRSLKELLFWKCLHEASEQTTAWMVHDVVGSFSATSPAWLCKIVQMPMYVQ